MSLAGTRTEQNLLAAYAGEIQGSNLYVNASGRAKKEGYIAVERAFLETAQQELQHAKRFLSFLDKSTMHSAQTTTTAFQKMPVLDFLKFAAELERNEGSKLYKQYAEVAEEEGFPEIAACWTNIITAEMNHGKRFAKLAELLEKGYFKTENENTMWRCLNCGYVHIGKEAPGACPACLHPQKFFEQKVNLFE